MVASLALLTMLICKMKPYSFVNGLLSVARFVSIVCFVVVSSLSTAVLRAERLWLPGDKFEVDGRPAFLFMPEESKRTSPQPWVMYAPTLPGYPDLAEKWMHQSFLDAGIAVAGVDVGEAYGSPSSHKTLNALYSELVDNRKFASKPCLFGRSRGGLWVSSWAIANPTKVSGILGIYPVFDFRTYPKIEAAAPAYGMTPEQLTAMNDRLNPVARLGELAKAKIPVILISGDVDEVVPMSKNSSILVEQYKSAGAESLVKLIVLPGQGHNMYEGFFHSQELVDFGIKQAKLGASDSK